MNNLNTILKSPTIVTWLQLLHAEILGRPHPVPQSYDITAGPTHYQASTVGTNTIKNHSSRVAHKQISKRNFHSEIDMIFHIINHNDMI